ncbi:hypothetical protein N7540_001867 [Penicillium herquei]|nr:hypothetical protein N7540_001867 [Penicillium herquei]
MDTATKLFDANQIETNHKGRKSPMDIFRESFQRIRSLEAKLFVDFENRLKKEKRKFRSSDYDEVEEDGANTILDSPSDQAVSQKKFQTWWNHLKEKASESPYDDIWTGTRLMVEVKDIHDELNILRNLVEDQCHVYSLWKGIEQKNIEPKGTEQDAKTNQFSFPHLTERLETIKTMIKDVNSVQGALKSLLDLKQKEATIIEAQTTRGQSDSEMVFTVVTIIFLPASFLASIFAFNVNEFPHEGGSVAYKSWWIFPIICKSVNFVKNRVLEYREKSKTERRERKSRIDERNIDDLRLGMNLADRQRDLFARLRNRPQNASALGANTEEV